MADSGRRAESPPPGLYLFLSFAAPTDRERHSRLPVSHLTPMASGIQPVGDTFATLEKSLQVSMVRHQAIQSNIANTNTPGFRRLVVDFESLIEGPATPQAILKTRPRLVHDTAPGRPDGNNVEFDREYADMEKNRLQFEALMEAINLKIQGLRNAITSK